MTNGDKYVGSFSEGKKHGEGSYYYSTGDVYKGFFKQNQK